mmetsp:Transcript_27292/g.84808  ORF Transcript_27292/g.84808 Transcript_27292/m.84808 type:complete len:181 (+) Transcript_27292:2-544(+)
MLLPCRCQLALPRCLGAHLGRDRGSCGVLLWRCGSAQPAAGRGSAAQAAATEEPTVLLDLAECGDLPRLRRALAAGGAPDAADQHGTTPLLVAIRNGHEEVAEALVRSGADVNRPGAWGHTPLMYATIWGRPRLVGFLLACGADPRSSDARGLTAAQHADRNVQPEAAELLRGALAPEGG